MIKGSFNDFLGQSNIVQNFWTKSLGVIPKFFNKIIMTLQPDPFQFFLRCHNFSGIKFEPKYLSFYV